MKPFRIHNFVRFANTVGGLEILSKRALGDEDETLNNPVADEVRNRMRGDLDRLEKDFAALRPKAAFAHLKRLRKLLDNPATNYHEATNVLKELLSRLGDETTDLTFLVIEPGKKELYGGSNLFGSEVAAKLPTAIVDIEEAAKCLALDRGTASVFHVMRALEVALQAFGTAIGLTTVDHNWQTLLDSVRGAVNRLPRSTAEDRQRHSKASEILAHLQAVKDAWRNNVMHPRESHTVEQAEEIWNHAKPLAAKIAEFL